MRRLRITFRLALMLVLLTSCTSFETRDGLYRDAETAATEEDSVAAVEEEVIEVLDEVDIFDEELALGSGDMLTEGFDLSRFTVMGDRFGSSLQEDVADAMSSDRGYDYYAMVAEIPGNDMMAVVNVDVEYMMQFDDGNWDGRRSEYANGEGHTISSFNGEAGYYSYDLRYNDDAGTYRIIRVRYDSVLELYDYSSESYDAEGVFSYAVRQQYCSDGAGGYYYQAVRQSLQDGTERISFSHFDGGSYRTYVSPSVEKDLIEAFSVNLFEELPGDLNAMIGDYSGLVFFANEDGNFEFVTEQ